MDSRGISVQEGEIDVRQVLHVFWQGRYKAIFLTLLFAIGSIFYSLSLPNQYKATALLAPAQTDGADLASTLGQLSGLATLAGFGIGGGLNNESRTAQEIMKSWSFIDSFIHENKLDVEVYAVNGWDRESNELKIKKDVYDIEKKEWLVENHDGVSGPPSSWKLFKNFNRMLSVSEDKKTGLVSISIEYYSPQIAKNWLDLYISAINAHMQTRQVQKVSNNISYLEAQIEKTSIAEMREVFYTIIEEQTKNKMVAEASPDYAFVAVGPSMVPEEKSKPRRAMICIVGTLTGFIISLFLIAINQFSRNNHT